MVKKQRRNLQDILASFEDCEHDWLSELGASARRRYPLYWQQYKEWLVAQGHEWGAKGSEILKRRSDDFMLRQEDPARWRFEKLTLAYYRWLSKDRRHENPTKTDEFKVTVVQSFFAHNRMDLVFKRKELKQGTLTRRYYDFVLDDLDIANKYATPKERWIFMGAKSLGQRVEVFSEILRKDIEPLLNEIPPVPIDILTDKVAGLWAHPCLDRDAIKAAREWLATRDDDNPYMLPSQTVIDGKPMTTKAINEAVKRVAEMCHKINPRTFRYEERGEGIRFHRFRKFLTTALKNARVDVDSQDYIIGHKQTGTRRAYTADQRVQAYTDAEAYLLLPVREQLDERITALEDIIGRDRMEELKKAGFRVEDKRTGRPLLQKKEPSISPEEFEELEKRREEEEKREREQKERKVVEEGELENALNHGWNPVMTLPSGKILIERHI